MNSIDWCYLDFSLEADNRMEMFFEENQDHMNEYLEEQREEYQRYAN
jgi:hypothetical protein